jgi:hypothetical protein
MKIELILEYMIGITETDEKRIQISNNPKLIFEIGYYMKIIEQYFSPKRLDIEEMKKSVEDDDYYKIHLKITELSDYYYTERGKYMI